uniref:Uncharacterized protein n=1 Tax=Acanthochromis polyacanthus TaxID=80966 RepID=A0A3Q1F5R5_9TELE
IYNFILSSSSHSSAKIKNTWEKEMGIQFTSCVWWTWQAVRGPAEPEHRAGPEYPEYSFATALSRY